jgi:hypothetical protein
MSRRQLLRRASAIGIAGAAGLLAGGVVRAVGGIVSDSMSADPAVRLASAMGRRDEMVRIGRAALAAGVVEPDARALVAGLRRSSPALDDALRDGSADDVRAALDAVRLREFAAASGLVRVGGWVLAPSEARACALVSLA